jgi:hypothetical protein
VKPSTQRAPPKHYLPNQNDRAKRLALARWNGTGWVRFRPGNTTIDPAAVADGGSGLYDIHALDDPSIS